MISLHRRRPAVTRPVAEPTTDQKRIAALEIDVAMLEVFVARKEQTISRLDADLLEARGTIREEREAHQAAMSSRVKVDDLPSDDLRRELAQERRNNVALSDQLAEARAKGNVPVRLGGWGR